MISLKSSFILLFAVTFSHISCQFLGLEKENSETYFFDFDELHHYRIEIDERDLYSKEGQENLTKREQLLIDLLSYEKPQTMTDTAFINQLTDIGFHLKKVDKMEFNMINNLFKEKTERES